MSRYRAYICGGDMRPGPRETDCPDALHDFPLPSGYVDASEEAMSRLSRGWSSKRCRRCGLYGWTPGRPRKGEELPARVRPELVEEDQK
jgi:hypothetical protein